jgi:hypothetical protein
MSNPLSDLFGKKAPAVKPTKTVGGMGRAVYGGFIQENETSSDLTGDKRFETYSEILANTSIVATGVRYFLNLTAKAEWSFVPAEHPEGQKYADLAEEMLTEDPRTPWHRIVRRSAMYRFYGFSIQEWTARRREDGLITFADIAPRAQRTIKRWDIDEDTGDVLGMLQTLPQSQREVYLPRQKVMYMVDDTLEDSPTGLGIFRHLVAPAARLRRYEQLEGFGFETDLRGIPVGRGPFSELAKMVEDGDLTAADRIAIEKPMRDFIENHIKSPKLALLLDSKTYETQDETERASNAKQWDVELLKGGSTSFGDVATAISRVNKEMARVLGVEQLLLGDDAAGSFALSKDKTNSFFLLVDGTLREITETVTDDLLKTLWQLNGFPEEAMPTIANEAVRFQDVEQIAASLRDMASAGAVMSPDDPAIGEVRDLLGLSRPDAEDMDDDAGLGNSKTTEGSVKDGEDDLPGKQEDGGD